MDFTEDLSLGEDENVVGRNGGFPGGLGRGRGGSERCEGDEHNSWGVSGRVGRGQAGGRGPGRRDGVAGGRPGGLSGAREGQLVVCIRRSNER